MFCLVKYKEKKQQLEEQAGVYAKTLLEFAYDNKEASKWIIANKDKVGDLADKFVTVSRNLDGDFTKAYGEQVGADYILEALKSTVDILKGKRKKYVKATEHNLDIVEDKLEALETQSNNVTTGLMLDKVKSNNVYLDYVNNKLNSGYKDVSYFLANSSNPGNDLAALPQAIINTINRLSDYLAFAFKVHAQDEAVIEGAYKNNQAATVTTTINELYTKFNNINSTDFIYTLDISKDLIDEQYVKDFVLAYIKSISGQAKANFSMFEAVEQISYYLDNKLKSSLKEAIDKLEEILDRKDDEADEVDPLYLRLLEDLKSAGEKYRKNELTNEEYMSTVDNIIRALKTLNPKHIELAYILTNVIKSYSVLVDIVADVYNSIFKALKLTE